MIIERLIIKNYKTFLDLDIDLSSTEDKPIILIGGTNGGGKTTFFEAIFGALYGLSIKKKWQFQELINAATTESLEEQEIKLHIHFSTNQQQYEINRKYVFVNGTVRESYELKVGNQSFYYGSLLKRGQKIKTDQEFNKVIQANLPKSLAHYFFFDAMEANYLLKQNKLEELMKDNIEQVMGFDRYLKLEKASSDLLDEIRGKEKLQGEKKKFYNALLQKQRQLKKELAKKQKLVAEKESFVSQYKNKFERLEYTKNQETDRERKIEYLMRSIIQTEEQEKNYYQKCEQFFKKLDKNMGMPLLQKSLGMDIQQILRDHPNGANWTEAHLTPVVEKMIHFLESQQLLKGTISKQLIISFLLSKKPTATNYHFTTRELEQFQKLQLFTNDDTHAVLLEEKEILSKALSIKLEEQEHLQQYQRKISKIDFSMLTEYQERKTEIITHKNTIKQLEKELNDLEEQIVDYEKTIAIDSITERDQLQKLKKFFNVFANELLKKQKIKMEKKLKQELNSMLLVYKGMIERVELPSDLKNLIFKVFHKNGNEIYLNQLNTASKQIVIQCLLKTLHTYGKYEPPIIIDTVMGVLDVASRETMLKSFLPTLSRQTILLSSDSEIRPVEDIKHLRPYLAKSFTFKRDKEKQLTTCVKGYFAA